MGGGSGFQNTPIFIDDKGDKVTLSTGGGFSIGVEFGYQANKFFDISSNFFYQQSSLSETLKNASASFDRLGVSFTPALIIPIKSGERLRFKLGGGCGLYSQGIMKIDGSKVPPNPPKYTFKYQPALGYHGSLIFESNFSERSSFTLGLKYYNINYEFTEEGSNSLPFDPALKLPDGSGIDFIFGYFYHFNL